MSPMILDDPRWNEQWHEELLTVSLLAKGPLQRRDLKEEIRRIQETKIITPFDKLYSHSYSNYNYWIRNLLKRGIIRKNSWVLELSGLGKWLSGSELGSLFERNLFLQNFICSKCSNSLKTVLLTPLLDSIDESKVNRKGEIWVDCKCPHCESTVTQHLGFNRDELVDFYSQAVAELKCFVNLEVEEL